MSKTIRPSKYTKALAQDICARIATGSSLRRIADDPAMPELPTMIAWLFRYASFRDAYAQAREIEADILADEVVDIADSETFDNATAAKIRVDARKWLAAKLKPAKYGEAKPASARKSPGRVVYRVSTGIPRAPDEADAVLPEPDEPGEDPPGS